MILFVMLRGWGISLVPLLPVLFDTGVYVGMQKYQKVPRRGNFGRCFPRISPQTPRNPEMVTK